MRARTWLGMGKVGCGNAEEENLPDNILWCYMNEVTGFQYLLHILIHYWRLYLQMNYGSGKRSFILLLLFQLFLLIRFTFTNFSGDILLATLYYWSDMKSNESKGPRMRTSFLAIHLDDEWWFIYKQLWTWTFEHKCVCVCCVSESITNHIE